MKHLHMRDLLGGRAVIVHMAHERGRKALPGALPAIGAVVHHVAGDRCRRARSGAADPHLRVSVHRAEDRDGLAQARFHDPDRDADEGLGRRAAADHVHIEIEPDTEIAGDERRRRRVATRIIQHAVNVGRLQSGIEDRVPDRPAAQGPGRLVRAPRIGGLADPDDRIFVAQVFRGGGIDLLSRQWHGVSPSQIQLSSRRRPGCTCHPLRPPRRGSRPPPGRQTYVTTTDRTSARYCGTSRSSRPPNNARRRA